MTDASLRREAARASVVAAAARLLREHGPAGLTTRGVAEAAGLQAPAIYRLFGDKDGLLEAVAEHVMASYVSAKAEHVDAAAAQDIDPLDDLRAGWDGQLAFGLANPAIFRLLSDPERVRESAAARSGRQVLAARMHRVAATGRLRVSEQRAVDLMQAAGVGVIQTLLSRPAGERDEGLGDAMYDAVLVAVLTGVSPTPGDDVLTAAVALRAALPASSELSDAEQRLMDEWLDRVIAARRH